MQRIIQMREQAKASGEPILRERSFQLLLDLIKEKQPKKILEIGVNVGLSGIAMLLTDKSATLTGIEIDEEKIAIAKRKFFQKNIFLGI